MDDDRKYGFDVLRILSMIMVVGLHYFYNCTISEFNTFSFNFVIMWIVEAICYVSVDCYVLITGYFGIKSKSINFRRLLVLATTTWFYSWFFLIVMSKIGMVELSFSSINLSLFPLINGHYWFITVYIMLALFQPVLNALFTKMTSQKSYYWYILMLVLFCIIPTFFPKADANLKITGGTNILWFVSLYFTGGILSQIEKEGKEKTKTFLILNFLISIGVPVFVKVMAMWLFTIGQGGAVFYHHNSFFIFSAACSIFCLCKNIKIENNKIKSIIKCVSPACFGVYIIHENIFIKERLWSKIYELQNLMSPTWPLFMLGTIIGVFIVSCIVEKIRLVVFKTLKIDEKIYWFITSISKRITGHLKENIK